MDDCPHEYWPELTEGNWQSGLAEDGAAQLVWAPGDSVFSLRCGTAVDPDCWEPRDGDRRLRLWSVGALDLLAALAGLSASSRPVGEGLLIMHLPEA